MAFDVLFSPMNIGTMTVKNRIVMTAAEFSLGQASGKPTQRLMDYYEKRAKGGVGLIIPGICRVNDMGGASTYTQLSMSHDYHIAPMAEFARRLHRYGAKLAIQLHHPGRQGMASATNSLPFVIPIAERFPGFVNTVFKCTPVMLSLEEKGICFSMQAPSKCELSKHGATRIHAMSKREIITQDIKTGKNGQLETDYVVLSLGVRPADGLAKELEELGLKNVYRAGDALHSGTIANACHSAYDTAMSIK